MKSGLHTATATIRAICLTAAIVLLNPAAVTADVSSAQAPEVEHLLEFIRTSGCAFIRNGREYGGDRAHRHVLRKYDYFRNRIMTTEEFITLAASVSTRSGEPYTYRCDGAAVKSTKEVLLEELERFRADD